MHPVNFHQTLTRENFRPTFCDLMISDLDLEGGLEVELEQSESLELETTEDRCTPGMRMNIHFYVCFSVLQFIYQASGNSNYMNLIILNKTY